MPCSYSLFLSLLAGILQNVLAQSYYSVVAPSTIRPNMEYHLSVSVHGVAAPVQLTLSIEGPDDYGNYNSISTVAVLRSDEMQIARLSIGDWSSGNYSLRVTGKEGLEFSNQTSLLFEPKSYSVFVQTDKAIYRPGDIVRFRVVIVDHLLVPTLTGAIDMHMTDVNGNRIKQWNRVFTSKGVVSNELQLSDQPPLGDWTIHVNISGQEYKKKFTVAEYVLPTFDVTVGLPPYATFNQSDIVVNVKATYTYGKGVKGDVVVKAVSSSNFYSEHPVKAFEAKAKIDGSVDVPVNLVGDLNLNSNFDDQRVEFTAVVTEQFTGRKYNASATIHIYQNDINVDLVKLSETFKPGLPYSCFFKVSYRDDSPVLLGADDSLAIFYGNSYREENWTSMDVTVPESGIVPVEIPPLPLNATLLAMKAVFRGTVYYLPGVESATSPSSSYIQAVLLSDTPLAPDTQAEIEVRASEPLSYLIYQVMSRGDIVTSQWVPVPNELTHRFRFPVAQRMSPKARVLVYYIKRDNGEVVADAVNFDVAGVFRTNVSVTTSVERTKPGGKVDIQVTTKPNAFVGILGIDQSVLLLKSGNDITQKDVLEELDSYDGGKKKMDWPFLYRRKKRSLWWPGSSTASEIFRDSGVVILTNGWVYEEIQMISYRINSVFYAKSSLDSDMTISTMNEEGSKSKTRHFFPETWLWNNTHAGSDGSLTIPSKVPDTITSWVISAFAVDSITGLGVAPETAKVTVFRPFFIKMNLPYSVIRGEVISLQVIVFNYHTKPLKAEVTLENGKGEFDFSLSMNEVAGPLKRETKTVMIPPEASAPVTFVITPRKLGYIDLLVSAISSHAGDSVLRKLLVKAEGVTHYFNKALLVDLRNPNSKPFQAAVSLEMPQDIVEGSESVSISAIGDLLGPSINNLDGLLRLPRGCGEQNMVNFVPSIVVLDYLSRANAVSPALRKKALLYIETGYQRELSYQRDDGSFSAFGNQDKSGSTWLSAFVIKSFKQASRHIDIDDKVINKTIQWLIRHQREDGAFAEPGEVHHKAMQGGSGGGAALTAYVLVALLENQAQKIYEREVELALHYVERELAESTNPYFAALAAYCLHLANHPAKDTAFNKLHSLARTQGDMLYWPVEGQSSAVEATSYGLLTLVVRGDIGAGVPVLRWLITNQNDKGGFSSTQDTVVALQALAALAGHLASSSVGIEVRYQPSSGGNGLLNISSDNALVLQRHQLPASTKMVSVEATGLGVGIIQVTWQYNLADQAQDPSFYLHPELETSGSGYKVSVCTHYNGAEDDPETNMAVMEVALPSGFQSDREELEILLTQLPEVKRVETKEGDTGVVIYFDKIGREDSCVSVPAYKTYSIAKNKPVAVKVYDYYNLAKRSSAFYEAPSALVCDICDGDEDCAQRCNAVEQQTPGDSGGIAVTPLFYTLAAALLWLRILPW